MRRLAVFLFWTIVFLALAAGIDQLLVRVEMPLPVLAEVQTFYVDFRSRLLRIGEAPRHRAEPTPDVAPAPAPRPPAAPGAPGAPVREHGAKPAMKKGGPAHSAETPSPRYLYVDRGGELHFADRLEEIPAAYREEAQRLER